MNFGDLFVKSLRTRSQLINCQTVRWRRPIKPFWLGIAKSKMFVIPEPKVRPREEQDQVDLLTNHYSTLYRTLMRFIKSDNPALTKRYTTEGVEIKEGSALSESIEESFKMNESWNMESAKRRDARTKSATEAEIEKAIHLVSEHEESERRRIEMIDAIVRKENELSASYITPENLDEAVEKCLNKIDCYDFAIDLEGNRYPGRDTLPSNLGSDKKEAPAEKVA